ncbi:MAG: hypothetical protein APF81_18260 [Desulfosporosinus sp. BRH_c37]|nr:MAG: hypothetical protein APF81_18260 [Desulfosporosinus sp. BRH_c37]
MSLDVAQNAVLPEKNKTEIAVVVVDILVNHAKCSLPFVLLVERKPPYPSNLPVINLCIVVIAINLAHVIIGKIIIVKTFPCLNAWEGFSFIKINFHVLNYLTMLTRQKIPHSIWKGVSD